MQTTATTSLLLASALLTASACTPDITLQSTFAQGIDEARHIALVLKAPCLGSNLSLRSRYPVRVFEMGDFEGNVMMTAQNLEATGALDPQGATDWTVPGHENALAIFPPANQNAVEALRQIEMDCVDGAGNVLEGAAIAAESRVSASIAAEDINALCNNVENWIGGGLLTIRNDSASELKYYGSPNGKPLEGRIQAYDHIDIDVGLAFENMVVRTMASSLPAQQVLEGFLEQVSLSCQGESLLQLPDLPGYECNKDNPWVEQLREDPTPRYEPATECIDHCEGYHYALCIDQAGNDGWQFCIQNWQDGDGSKLEWSSCAAFD